LSLEKQVCHFGGDGLQAAAREADGHALRERRRDAPLAGARR
jgi:hypothetical protein